MNFKQTESSSIPSTDQRKGGKWEREISRSSPISLESDAGCPGYFLCQIHVNDVVLLIKAAVRGKKQQYQPSFNPQGVNSLVPCRTFLT